MNCEEFFNRMNDRIDRGESLVDDDRLVAHATRCDGCAERLRAWSRIVDVLGVPVGLPTASVPRRRALASVRRIALAAAVAACVMIAFGLGRWRVTRDGNPLVAENLDRPPSADRGEALAFENWNTTIAWNEWLAPTVPAVDSVKEGVAPIGRSLIQAAAILSAGAGFSAETGTRLTRESGVGVAG